MQKDQSESTSGPVIGALENSLLTEHLTMSLPWRGERLPDPRWAC